MWNPVFGSKALRQESQEGNTMTQRSVTIAAQNRTSLSGTFTSQSSKEDIEAVSDPPPVDTEQTVKLIPYVETHPVNAAQDHNNIQLMFQMLLFHKAEETQSST